VTDWRIGQRIERTPLEDPGSEPQIIGNPLCQIGQEIRGFTARRSQATLGWWQLTGIEAELPGSNG